MNFKIDRHTTGRDFSFYNMAKWEFDCPKWLFLSKYMQWDCPMVMFLPKQVLWDSPRALFSRKVGFATVPRV